MVLPSALAHQGVIEEVLADLLERALKIPYAYALEVLPMTADDDFYHMFDGLYLSGLPRPIDQGLDPSPGSDNAEAG
jgi:hypothetical protein